MGNVSWTSRQKDAIDARGGPLLISAAAGSGKTSVLVERIIEIITDKDHPVDIDKFLVVTFTNAAAGEMRERIGKSIESLLSEDPHNENLLRQQLLLQKAQISTIDSFCRSLVKEYFYELDVPADFRIADEEELRLMKEAAIERVFEQRYRSGDEAFLSLSDRFSDYSSDSKLRGIVESLYNELSVQPFRENRISEMLALYDTDLDPAKTPWGDVLVRRAKLTIPFLKSCVKKMRSMIEPYEVLAGYNKTYSEDEELIGKIEAALDSGEWEKIRSALSEGYPKMPAISKKTLETDERGEEAQAVKDDVRNFRDKVFKKAIDNIKTLFLMSANEVYAELAHIKETAQQLFSLVVDYWREYFAIKIERGAVDYADVEHLALQLLATEENGEIRPTEKAQEIASRYEFVMVDEYQDTNRLQDTIFTIISGNNERLFVVGDVKQSIYRFRHSVPEIFIARRSGSVPYDRDNEQYPAAINLDANFRSRESVTKGVNFVFRNVMSETVGGLDYNDDEALKAQSGYADDGKTALSFHLLEYSGSSDEDDDGDDEKKCEAEARYIGKQILEMLKTEVVTERDGTQRPAALGDFCIMLRSIKNAASAYASTLLKMGIPAVCDQGEKLLLQPEVRLATALLRTIENPARDVEVTAVLLSPLFGFTPDDLALLRSGKHRNYSLYEALLIEAEYDERAAYFIETISSLRSEAENLDCDELIRRVYDETLLPEIVLSNDDGEYRRKNLLLLAEYARSYEGSGIKGLSGFLAFLDRLDEEETKLMAADRIGAAANAVRIITIHKSKGLEFPFCFVGALGREFNSQDNKENVRIHMDLGIGTKVASPDHSYDFKGVTRTAVDCASNAETISEELRVLYVAMTRAKERLALVATVKNIDSTLNSVKKKLVYNGRILPYTVLKAKGFSDILISCMLISRCGEELRERADYDGNICDHDDSDWNIFIRDITEEESDVHELVTEPSAGREYDVSGEIDDDLKMLREKLGRTYRFRADSAMPVKVSASGAAERAAGFGVILDRPAFLNTGGLTAAEKGTALHAFVQHCDFENARRCIEAEKTRLVEKGFITRRQAQSVDDKRVEAFLSSSLMAQMESADRLEREYQFTVEIPAAMAGYPDGGTIILQGAIDAFFVKDGRITVIDYKTDNVNDPEELASRYSVQLMLYKNALEQIFGLPVERCVLYSFRLGQEVEVNQPPNE